MTPNGAPTAASTSTIASANSNIHGPVSFAAAKTVLAGAIAGAIAKTAVAPLDRTKILMQVSQMYGWKSYRGSVWHSMQTIWQSEGPRGFFRGNSATVARIMPYAAIQYSTFEFYNKQLAIYVFHPDSKNPMKRFIAGALAGSSSVIATYPVDMARTVLAVQTSTGKARAGLFGTLFGIWRTSGVAGLYRGVYPTLAGVIPYAGISFFTFGVLKRVADNRGISNRSRFLTNLMCGGTAGLTAQCCTYPLDLVRRRLQALHTPELMTEQERAFLRAAETQNPVINFSIYRAVSFIVKNEGLHGLYRGVSINFMKTAPAMAISFTCYDFFRNAFGVPSGKYSATTA